MFAVRFSRLNNVMVMKRSIIGVVVILSLTVIALFAYNRILLGDSSETIEALTSEATVVSYVKDNGRLPDYYITSGEARKRGWKLFSNNICRVLPGRAIGGDVFDNYERRLPNKESRIWYEADLNYRCGKRNGNRLVFSNDTLIYVTYDHYQTFKQR